MCGRYYIEMDDGELDEIVREAEKNVQAYTGTGQIMMKTRGEIFPTDIVPVLTAPGRIQAMQWGFTLSKGGPVINARCETVFEKTMFQQAMADKRCLIPASGYYEWASIPGSRKKEKYTFQAPGSVLYFAGCYRMEKTSPVSRFVILTRQAIGGAESIHDRMPVMVPGERIADWLKEGLPGIAFEESLTAVQYEIA